MKTLAKFFGGLSLFAATFFLIPISNAVREEELSDTHLFFVLSVIFGSLILAALFGIVGEILEWRKRKKLELDEPSIYAKNTVYWNHSKPRRR